MQNKQTNKTPKFYPNTKYIITIIILLKIYKTIIPNHVQKRYTNIFYILSTIHSIFFKNNKTKTTTLYFPSSTI